MISCQELRVDTGTSILNLLAVIFTPSPTLLQIQRGGLKISFYLTHFLILIKAACLTVFQKIVMKIHNTQLKGNDMAPRKTISYERSRILGFLAILRSALGMVVLIGMGERMAESSRQKKIMPQTATAGFQAISAPRPNQLAMPMKTKAEHAARPMMRNMDFREAFKPSF